VKYLYILIGGGIGSTLRYLLSNLIINFLNKAFPLGTLIVNITGCFLIGLLFGFSEKIIISSNIRLFIFVGLLGGFTTFSSFGLETFNLIRQSEIKYAILNFTLNNFLGILFVFIGFTLTKLLLKD
jgi:CrcB protein